jgi:hypothetical protein
MRACETGCMYANDKTKRIHVMAIGQRCQGKKHRNPSLQEEQDNMQLPSRCTAEIQGK